MFQSFFNYDNVVWRFIGKLADLILLNFLWIICSIPIITAGAATTAVYYVTLKLVRDEESGTVRLYFRSFRQNLKQASMIWIVLLAFGAAIFFDMRFLTLGFITGALRMAMAVGLGCITILYLFIALYVFPLQAQFYNPVKQTLINACIMAVRHLPYTLGLLAADGVIAGLMYYSLFFIPQLFVLFILFGFPLVAFVNSHILVIIFRRYMPSQEEQELRPLFSDEAEEKKP